MLTAGGSRFLNLSQSGYRPDRYGERSRFEPVGPTFLGGSSGAPASARNLVEPTTTQKITVSSIRAVALIA